MSYPNKLPRSVQEHLGHGPSTKATSDESTLTTSQPAMSPSHLSRAGNNRGRFNEEFDASQRGSSIVDGNMHRSSSVMSQGESIVPSRSGTLKKRASVKRSGSLKRVGSRRSSRAGSVRSLALHPGAAEDEENSAFHTPVPIAGNPTEVLANRFQQWRKILKDLITYFREVQSQYEHRAKSMVKISNLINNIESPTSFLPSGGINDALEILRGYHSQAILEAHKAKDIEDDVVLQLTGLRSDLQQKIKEIKGLSGDFKSSAGKEMESTRKAVAHLQDALGQSDFDPTQATGKQDPYLLRLAVDRQVERQIEEENYLHQAYLNLEASGTELEAIVVGEIQKAYNAYSTILKREADFNYNTIEDLQTRPIAMPKDTEWRHFIENDERFVDPRIPVRRPENIIYPGRDHELAAEVRAGLLERKSKYLKSYTGGWYVLSPTHLHEFKSADKTQAPLMSLYLPEQKLGSHSTMGSSSNKFMLRGRQTGTLHRGHSWVFRAESYDTMMAWYEDIKALTEKSPRERNAFVREHARSFSGTSQRSSSDGGMDEDDEEPFSATTSEFIGSESKQDVLSRRPQAGGRFPSDIQISSQRGSQAPLSPSSGSDDGMIDGQAQHQTGYGSTSPVDSRGMEPNHASQLNQYARQDGVNPYTYEPLENDHRKAAALGAGSMENESMDHGMTAAQVTTAYKTYELDSLRQVASQESSQIAADDGRSYPSYHPESFVSAGNSNVETSGTRATQRGSTPADVMIDVPRPSASAMKSPQSTSSASHLHVPGEYPKEKKLNSPTV